MPALPRHHPDAFALERIDVTADAVAGFVDTFLLEGYDKAKPIPAFHYAIWDAFASNAPRVAVAAPRGHAKTTGGVHAFGLASLVFGSEDFGLMIGATEKMAIKLLANIRTELTENIDLVNACSISIVKDNQDELIGRVGGREFCLLARGSGQAVRGLLWRRKRPGLILIDDLENDEQVESEDQRQKLDEWFNNALLQCGSDDAKFRMVGTILHADALLERILKDSTWVGLRFRAHRDFDDFTEILWPEKFTIERLKHIRQGFINRGKPSGYSREYLSHPMAELDAFFKAGDFVPMTEEDHRRPKMYYGGIDFAITKGTTSDYTVFVIGGMDSDGYLHIVHVERARLDSLEVINRWFELHRQFGVTFWAAEDHNISKAIGPFLEREMRARQVFMSVEKVPVKGDKKAMATPIQARMRAKGVKFDKTAEWYGPFEAEMRSFDRGIHDDCVDAMANLGHKLDRIMDAMEAEEISEEEYRERVAERRRILREGQSAGGRSVQTGY